MQAMITQSHMRLKQHFPLLWFQSNGYPKETNAIYRCSLLPAQTCLLLALTWQSLMSDPNQRCGNWELVISPLCKMELDQTISNIPFISQILDLRVLSHISPGFWVLPVYMASQDSRQMQPGSSTFVTVTILLFYLITLDEDNGKLFVSNKKTIASNAFF